MMIHLLRDGRLHLLLLTLWEGDVLEGAARGQVHRVLQIIG